MWSKIKYYIDSYSIPISAKLTATYTVILIFTLLLTNILAVISLYFIVGGQAEKDLDTSTTNVITYLQTGRPLDQRMLAQPLLMQGVAVRVFDNQNQLILDSNPDLPDNDTLFIKNKHYKQHSQSWNTFINKNAFGEKDIVLEEYSNETYCVLQLDWNAGGEFYHLQFIKPMSVQFHFLYIVRYSLLMADCIGLLIAILAGTYISRKVLQPIRIITSTAKKIEINDLNTRILFKDNYDELSELAKTFNHMLDRIQEGFEQQRRFVADASHELRTPVTVISGYTDMLNRWGRNDVAALTEGLNAIKSETTNMQGLIEKLLFLARADQGQQIISKEPLPMKQLLEEIVQETHLIAPNHNVILEMNDSGIIFADVSFIKQMLRIFMDNAIKYTPDNGIIKIVAQQTIQHLAIIIQDTGIGIPQEDLPKIFDRFYCVDKSRSKTTGGTGLGLSIAQWIARQHDISIEVDSIHGQGTNIRFNIPLLLIPSQE